MTFDDNLYSP